LRIAINLNREKPRRRKLGLRFKDLKPGKFIKAPPILLLIVGAVTIVLMLAVHFYQGYRLDSLDEEIQIALADSASLSTTIEMLKDIREKKREMLQRIDVVKQIEEHRYLLPKLMDQVSTALPELLWLNRWNPVQGDSTAGWFELQGESFSNIRVAEFMTRLERSPLIEEVVLIRIQEKIEDGISTMVFTLRCRFFNGKRT
jgi:type IV pilus assembly protein PilN